MHKAEPTNHGPEKSGQYRKTALPVETFSPTEHQPNESSIRPNRVRCDWQTHFSFRKTSLSAVLLYSRVLALTRNGTRVYNAAIGTMVQALLLDPQTIMRANKELVDMGCLKVRFKRSRHPTEYDVVTHDEFARLHPDECLQCRQLGAEKLRAWKEKQESQRTNPPERPVNSKPDHPSVSRSTKADPDPRVLDDSVWHLAARLCEISNSEALFDNQLRENLKPLLDKYASKDIEAVFRTALENGSIDLSDPKRRYWELKKFTESARALLETRLTERQRRQVEAAQRQAYMEKMQAEREAERAAFAKREAEEAALFDPLSDLEPPQDEASGIIQPTTNE